MTDLIEIAGFEPAHTIVSLHRMRLSKGATFYRFPITVHVPNLITSDAQFVSAEILMLVIRDTIVITTTARIERASPVWLSVVYNTIS